MRTINQLFSIGAILVLSLGLLQGGHSLQKCIAEEIVNSESFLPAEQELVFDKKMNALFLSGIEGKTTSYGEIVAECDQQLAAQELLGLAKAWKGTALIMQCAPLFKSGNSQEGLKKWEGGLDFVKQADKTDASLLTKKQIASVSLASWQYSQKPARKEEITRRGLRALRSIHDAKSNYWAKEALPTKTKLLSDAVKALQFLGMKNQRKAFGTS